MKLTMLIVFITLVTPKLNAQNVPNLQGKTVRVHSPVNDISFTGHVSSQNQDSVFIIGRYGAAEYRVPWNNLDKLEVRVPSKTRGRNAVQGAIIGAVVGLIPIFQIGAGACSDCDQTIFDILGPLVGIDLGFATIGAGVGVLASRGSWEVRPLLARKQ